MKRIRLTKQANADISNAAEWYERKESGLGDRFVDCVDGALEKIAANPQGYAKSYKQLRRCDVPKFPYALWFEIRPDNSLVVACLHHRRNRALIKERATGVREMPDPS